jgi:hypothetical protein
MQLNYPVLRLSLFYSFRNINPIFIGQIGTSILYCCGEVLKRLIGELGKWGNGELVIW